MKKLIFTLVGAILFSFTTAAQDYTGIWQAEEETSYYVVILYNYDNGYSFTDKDTLRLTYSGDYEGSQIAYRKKIL